MEQVEWIFFDIGSTLVDETEAYRHRIRDAISGTDITLEQFNEKLIYFAKQNLKGDLEAIKYFGLTKTAEYAIIKTIKCKRGGEELWQNCIFY